jgi:hypothetical protein
MISLPDQISGGAGKGKTLEEQEGKIGNFQQNGGEELGTFAEEGGPEECEIRGEELGNFAGRKDEEQESLKERARIGCFNKRARIGCFRKRRRGGT